MPQLRGTARDDLIIRTVRDPDALVIELYGRLDMSNGSRLECRALDGSDSGTVVVTA